jgi:CheY-like chemotaxis protein
MQRRKIRILVIDDDLAMLSLYEEHLGNRLGYRVDRASIAGEATRMASERMYDIAICDAKLNYKRSSFGGLLLAEEFARRFGCNAVLVVSPRRMRAGGSRCAIQRPGVPVHSLPGCARAAASQAVRDVDRNAASVNPSLERSRRAGIRSPAVTARGSRSSRGCRRRTAWCSSRRTGTAGPT